MWRSDRRARRVVDGEAEPEPRARGGGALGGPDRRDERDREPVASPDDVQANAVLEQPRRLGLEMAREQAHERRHLARRALPVVGGEGEQRQGGYALIGSGFDDSADGVGARAMAGGAGETAAGGPAAVAVHDDGHVERSTL